MIVYFWFFIAHHLVPAKKLKILIEKIELAIMNCYTLFHHNISLNSNLAASTCILLIMYNRAAKTGTPKYCQNSDSSDVDVLIHLLFLGDSN